MRIYLFIAAIAGGVTYLITPLIRHIAIEDRRRRRSACARRAYHSDTATGWFGHADRFHRVDAVRIPHSVHSRIVRAIATGVGDSRRRHYDQSAWHGRDLWDLDWMLKLAGQLLISVFVAWAVCRSFRFRLARW